MSTNIDNYRNEMKKHIGSLAGLDNKLWKNINSRLHYEELPKYSIITKTGEVENHIYALMDGVVRLYYEFGKSEYTLRFNFPISFFSAYASFISRQPAYMNIETLTPVKLFKMSFNECEELYSKFPLAETIRRKIVEHFYMQREIKEISIHTKTAEENYYDLFSQNPEVIHQVPLKHIASYLGITPESLSRIRSRQSKKI